MKIGIIHFREFPCHWETEFLADVQNAISAEFINIDIPRPTKNKGLLWRAYQKLDDRLFSPKSFALDQGKSINYSKTIDVSEIGEISKLDFIINLSEGYTDVDLFNHTSKGILFFDYLRAATGQFPPMAIEYLEGNNEITLTLYHGTTSYDNAFLLDRVTLCRDIISYKRTLHGYFWQATSLLQRNLPLMLNKGLSAHDQVSKSQVSTRYSEKKIPPVKIIGFIGSLFFKKILGSIQNLFTFNQWILLLKTNVTNENFHDIKSYKEILPPKDRFWADPFLVLKDERYYLYIEELVYSEKLGKLAVIPLNDDFSPQQPITILKKDYHLSYPFIFEDNGEMYMIPETSGNRDIQLYRCTQFPEKWEFECTLMEDIVAVDTTLYKKDGKYWMLTNVQSNPHTSKHNDLNLYWSNELKTQEWKPYHKNPVVSDINTARPAGNIFLVNDKLVRPAQNCAPYYGYGINFCEIKKMAEAEFSQELYIPVVPNWDSSILSTHTFNRIEGIAVSDALKRRSKFF